MTPLPTRRFLPLLTLIACAMPGWSQPPAAPAAPATPARPAVRGPFEFDAMRTRDQLGFLMRRYPPQLRTVLSIDNRLLTNQNYLAPYPDLVSFLDAHPEIVRNPSFYFGEPFSREPNSMGVWRDAVNGLYVIVGIGMAISLIIWVIRAMMDHRRWNRLNKVQTEVHSRILDRMTGNEELLTYIQSPAGSKFLQSAPITLDSAPRAYGSPISRIVWTVQAGVVLAAGGIGLLFVSSTAAVDAAQPLHAMGILAIALGAGFMISAIISFAISRHFGLVETPVHSSEMTRG